MKTINIMANKENGNILDFAKSVNAPCLVLWSNNTFISTIHIDDVDYVDISKVNETGLILVYINKLSYVVCKSICLLDLQNDIEYIYAYDEGEFYEE